MHGTSELKSHRQEVGPTGTRVKRVTNTSGRQLFSVYNSSHAQPIHAAPSNRLVGFPPVASQRRTLGGFHVPSAISEQWSAVCSSRF